MNSSLRVAITIVILSCVSMAQDSTTIHAKKIQSEIPQLEDYEPSHSTQAQQKTTLQPVLNGQNNQVNNLLKEINDSLLTIIRMVETRKSEINKLIQHEQYMSPKEIMIKRLRLIGYMVNGLKREVKGGSQ